MAFGLEFRRQGIFIGLGFGQNSIGMALARGDPDHRCFLRMDTGDVCKLSQRHSDQSMLLVPVFCSSRKN